MRIPIAEYITHPRFHFRVHDHILFNDVGLVLLQYPITNDSQVEGRLGPWGTICVPPQDETYNNALGNNTSTAG